MARLASVANAGFEPVPQNMVQVMASLVEVEPEGDYAIFDPCAGEGAAIIGMTHTWFPSEERREANVTLYACEMELTRAEKLKSSEKMADMGWRNFKPQHGDAFALQWSKANISIGYINSPFDWDKSEARRMEEKFLRRFVPTIHVGGVLMFVLPYNAIQYSAETIAKNFTNVQCVRFPDWDFGSTKEGKFNRAVVLGEKISPLLDPDARVVANCMQWSAEWEPISDTWNRPLVKARAFVETSGNAVGFSDWKMAPIDINGMLARAKPWYLTDRGGRLQPIVGVVPDKPAHDGLDRVFPVALPLKPAYLASGIAAGVFNGELICPDDPESELPDILLKGVFRKDFVHVPSEDKRNKDGEKTQETHVQQPELVITILDLRTKKYSELVSSVDTTGEMDPAKMSVGDLLQHYGKSMMASMLKSCPVMHDPAKDAAVSIPGISRPLYTAQAHAVTAALKILGGVDLPLSKRKGQACFILGEVGVGKTGVALATSVAMGAKRTLVMCPPHLVPEWEEQVSVWFPEHRSIVLDDVRDVHALAESTDERPTIAIFSRETAKLSHAWAGIGPRMSMVRGEKLELPARCPKCNEVPDMGPEQLAAKRRVCGSRKRRALNVAAKLSRKLGFVLAKAAPNSPHVTQVLNSHALRRAVAKWARVPSDATQAQKRQDDLAAAWKQIGESGKLESFTTELFHVVAGSDNREHVIKLGEVLLMMLVAVGRDIGFQSGARAMYAAGNDEPYGYTAGGEKRRLALRLLACCEKEARGELAKEIRGSMKPDYSHAVDALRHLWRAFDTFVEEFDSEQPITDSDFKPRNDDGWDDHEWGALSGALRAIGILSELAIWGDSDPCGERLYQAIPEPRRVALAPYIAKRFPKLFDCLVFDECFVRGTMVSGKRIEDIRIGDTVDAFNEKTGQIEQRKVTRLYRNAPKSLLMRITVDGCEVVCTPGHPFFTDRGWVKACELLSTDYMLTHEFRNNAETETLVLKDVNGAERLDRQLQDRCWQREQEGCGGDRRNISQHSGEKSLGREEGRSLTRARVESVQVLEPGSDGTFGGVCPDGLVYNLEVEDLHTYIANGIVVHNCHELSNNIDSAQSQAMMRLAQTGIPALALTGSAMNGYAKSLFAGQWALDPDFRREFERNQEGKFVARYGYIKIKVEMKDGDGKNISFGAVSDRVERTEREAGNAPGVLPLFVLQYLLKKAVVIHKDDLAIDLPPCNHIVEFVNAGSDLQGRYDALARTLKNQIKRDAFGPLAGKLFGQVSELPSYLDRATSDMGNCSDGWWRIRYPEDCEGGLVAEQEPFDASSVSPKEQWMLDKIRSELAEDRNVLVFGYHAEVLPRLRRLIQDQLGEPCALLLAGNSDRVDVKRSKKLAPGEGPVAKVQPDKRKPWIQENVVARGVRVMVVNSTAVQTGLNNLVHFNSIIWMENPACNPIGFRQANGRIFRPGQRKETRIYFPVYEDTAQAAAHSLLMLKVGVSEGTDGLDARGAMAAAGVGEQATMSAFGVGKQLFSMMEDERARVPRFVEKRQEKSPLVLPTAPVVVAPPLPIVLPTRKPAEAPQLKLF